MRALSPGVQRIAAVLLLVLLALAVDAALQPLRQFDDTTALRLAQARQTMARYRAVLAEADAPAAAPTGVLLEGASASQAAAALQGQIKQAASAAGARLDSVEALNDGGDAGRLVLRARLTADTASLQAMLHRLESARPVLLVDQLYVRGRTGQAEKAGLHLDVRFDVIGFLAPEAGG
jgi:hypothetical protein